MIRATTPTLASQLPPRICSHSLGLAGAFLAGGGGGSLAGIGAFTVGPGTVGGIVVAAVLGAGSDGSAGTGFAEAGDIGLVVEIEPRVRSSSAIRSFVSPTVALKRSISSCRDCSRSSRLA